MTARDELVAYLQAICLATEGLEDVRVIPSKRAIGKLSKPVIIVTTDNYTSLPEAPQRIVGNFILVLVSNLSDVDEAENDLAERVEALLPRLCTAGLQFGTATQTEYDDAHLSFDITLMSILS